MIETTNISRILRRLMADRQLKTTELARKVNLPQPTVHRIVSGISPNPHLSSLMPIADFFSITLEQLKGIEEIEGLGIPPKNTPEQKVQRIPLYPWDHIPKRGEKARSRTHQYVYATAQFNPRCYALMTQDASMAPRFPELCILIVDPDKPVTDRSYIIVRTDPETSPVFRQVIKDGSRYYLKATSPELAGYHTEVTLNADTYLGTIVQSRQNY